MLSRLEQFLGRRYSLRAILQVALLAFIWGLATFQFNVFPYSLLREARTGAIAVRDALTGKLPWYYVAADVDEVVSRSQPDRMQPGLTLVTELGMDDIHRIRVVDRGGRIVHEWKVDWFEIWPHADHIPQDLVPQSRPGASVHGTAFLDDGSVVFNFEYLGMVRLNPCGEVRWRLPYQTHHSISVTERGTLWASGRITHERAVDRLPGFRPPFFEETAIEVSADGEKLREISIFDVLLRNGSQGYLYMGESVPKTGDILHLNDVEEFPASMTEGVFRHGDIMVSTNIINTIMVFDPTTQELRFVSSGPHVHQHDPDFVDGNNVQIFDNNYVGDLADRESSRIVSLSAVTGKTSIVFAGSPHERFYSYNQGKQQILKNGNTLITATREGRAFEITPSGQVVWEYTNLVKNGVLGIITDAQRLDERFDEAFFRSINAACGGEAVK